MPKRPCSKIGTSVLEPSRNMYICASMRTHAPPFAFTCLSSQGKRSAMNANADGYTLRGTSSALFVELLAFPFSFLLEPRTRTDAAFFLPPTPPFPVFLLPLLRLLPSLALVEASSVFREPEEAVPTRGFFAAAPRLLVCGNVCLPCVVLAVACCRDRGVLFFSTTAS